MFNKKKVTYIFDTGSERVADVKIVKDEDRQPYLICNEEDKDLVKEFIDGLKKEART